MNNDFEHITLLGAGLLGGSLGIDIHEIYPQAKVSVWSRSQSTRDQCERASWCHQVYESPEEASRRADLVVLCTTVEHIPELLQKIQPYCPANALITDVGSTKRHICEVGNQLFPVGSPATFIGSHPMAGSEKAGIDAARRGLFEGQSCILTPIEATQGRGSKMMDRLTGFWESLGMKVFPMTPDAHDKLVADISHLPHAIAVALIHCLNHRAPQQWSDCAGRGLKDTTRIAEGDAALWSTIFMDNKDEVIQSLQNYSKELQTFLRILETGEPGELDTYLKAASELRKKLN